MHSLEYSVSMWVEAESLTKLLRALSKYAINLGLEGASSKTDQLKNAHTLVSWLQTIGKNNVCQRQNFRGGEFNEGSS